MEKRRLPPQFFRKPAGAGFAAACFSAALFLFSSCARSPLATSVEFRGKVYYGMEATDGSSKIIVLGPLAGARVICLNNNQSALTDSSGAFILKTDAPSQFLANNYDTYLLEASGTSSPAVYPSGNYISQQIDVRGRAGDTIYVRDFLLYKNKQ